ncbi:MAG: ribonuclease P protein component [Thiohalospira sp.]
MGNQKFSKYEKLKSRKKIKQLFDGGNQVNHFPFLINWKFENEYNDDFPAQVAISVSKRKIKKAVQRNRIKRKIREVYRKNKFLIYNLLNDIKQSICFMVIYNSTDELNYSEMEKELLKGLKKMIEAIKTK